MKSSTEQTLPIKHFAALDGWRGIAACMVAALHFPVISHLTGWPPVDNARLFVDFFFVLSGFVIALSYEEKLRSGYGIAPFMALRWGRLFPLHLVTLLGMVVMIGLAVTFFPQALAGSSVFSDTLPFANDTAWNGRTILNHLALVQGFQEVPDWNGPSWSISVEFFAYLVFALAVLLMGHNLWKGLFAIVILGPALVLGSLYINGISLLGFARGLFGFGMGALVMLCVKQAPHVLLMWRDKPKIATCLEVFALVLMGAFLSVFQFAPGETNQLIINAPYFVSPYIFAIVLIIFANEGGAISRVLKTKPLQILGMWSYGIYMIHFLVSTAISWPLKAMNKKFEWDFITYTPEHYGYIGVEKWHGDLIYIGYFGVIFAASWMSYRWLEKPAMKLVRSRVKKAQNRKPVAASPLPAE